MRDNCIKTPSLKSIEMYLLQSGWMKFDHQNKKMNLFCGPTDQEGNRLEILLPKRQSFVDYTSRALDAIKILAFIKGEDIHSLINEISLINQDIFSARIIDVEPSGSIPLTVAASNVSALKNLFIFSACSEEKSLPYFEKPLAIGLAHAEHCQFGHTFEGSFGFTINSPIKEKQVSIFEAPFERRVIERIIRGLDLVEQSVKEDNGDIVVDNFDIGLNSRMCESLLEMSCYKTKKLGFQVFWSTQIKVAEELQDRNEWYLGEAAYEVLEYAAEELKKVEPSKETIIGPIITLHSTKNPMSEEAFNRKATVKYEYDGKVINVKLDLDKSGYNVAYEAHGKGLPIKIVGSLFRKGNTWKMTDIEEVTMLLR